MNNYEAAFSGTLIVFNGISKDNTFLRKIKSFRYAIAETLKLITTEHSIMVQCSLGIVVTIAGFLF
jgi:diacylglycerol kinase (ATP)